MSSFAEGARAVEEDLAGEVEEPLPPVCMYICIYGGSSLTQFFSKKIQIRARAVYSGGGAVAGCDDMRSRLAFTCHASLPAPSSLQMEDGEPREEPMRSGEGRTC